MARNHSAMGPLFLLALMLSHASSTLSEPLRHVRSEADKRQLIPTLAVPAPAAASSSAAEADDLADFGQTIKVLGLMDRTDQDFKDGLALDLLSPKNRTLVVQKNTSPLPGKFVTGSTGEPFMALANYSYVIKFNETANDLIGKVEVPYDPVMLKKMGIDVSNTYVGTLAADKKSWVISESQRNVHVTENKTRIIKMTSMDGEYILLGRKIEDTTNIFVQYGQGDTRTVNVTGGNGIQEAEFIDGLRFSMESQQPFRMNVEIVNGIAPNALPAGTASVNSFAWVVNTSIPTQTIKNANIKVPFNRAIIASKPSNSTSNQRRLTVARRSLSATTQQFTPLNPQSQEAVANEDSIQVSGLTQLDGQYVILLN